jgi:16S rRNA (cytidine1402-2'-O)-methyltransferase
LKTGKLHVVSTPIGNLKDITYRAVETLKAASLIIAEDTRVTRILLNHYGISVPMASYHKFNEKSRVDEVVGILEQGNDVCLVSDAGTPLMSDPGFVVVKECIERGYEIQAVPGASALLSAAVVSGFDPGRFLFWGFLEKQHGPARKEIESFKNMNFPVIIYESPNRIKDTLELINEVLGGTRAVSVSKEITKLHEKTLRGNASEVNEAVTEDIRRGEFVVVIGPAPENAGLEEETNAAVEFMNELIRTGTKKSEAVKLASSRFNINRNDLYKKAHLGR